MVQRALWDALQVVAEDDSDIGEWKLSRKEEHAQSALAKLAQAEVPIT